MWKDAHTVITPTLSFIKDLQVPLKEAFSKQALRGEQTENTSCCPHKGPSYSQAHCRDSTKHRYNADAHNPEGSASGPPELSDHSNIPALASGNPFPDVQCFSSSD